MYRILLLILLLPTLASADRASTLAKMEQLTIEREQCKLLLMFNPSIPFPYDKDVLDIVQKRLELGAESQTDNDPFFSQKNLKRSAIYLEKNFRLKNDELAYEFSKYDPLTDEEINNLAEQVFQSASASMPKIKKIFESKFNASNFDVPKLRKELKSCIENFLHPSQLDDPYMKSVELPPVNLANQLELNAHRLRLTEQFYDCFTLAILHPDFEFPFDDWRLFYFELTLTNGFSDDVADKNFDMENLKKLSAEMLENYKLRISEIDVALMKFPLMTVEEKIMFEAEDMLMHATAYAKSEKLFTSTMNFDYLEMRSEIKKCVEKFR